MKKPATARGRTRREPHPRDKKTGRFISHRQAEARTAQKRAEKAARALKFQRSVAGYKSKLNQAGKGTKVKQRWKNSIQTLIKKYGQTEKEAKQDVAEYMAKRKRWLDNHERGEEPVFESPLT